ncbi:hypothetical protein ACW2QC_16770 [Virgibacillus sp. FSP13]
MKKKISLFFIIAVLFLTQSFSSVSANELDSSKITEVDDYTLETVEENDNYYKIKITEEKTGNIEYLEWINEDGEARFIATDSDGKETVITDEDIENSIEPTTQDNTIDNTSNKSEPPITTFSNDAGGGGGSKWMPAGGWRASRSALYTSFSACVGALTGFLTNGIANAGAAYLVGTVSGIASNMVSYGIHDIWFDAKTYYNVNDTCELKDSVLVYRYPDYTGFLGATTRHWRNCRW